MATEVKEFLVRVEVSGAPMMYKAFRAQIQQAINSFPYLRFLTISENRVPDRFSLTDPDKVPEGFM